MSTSSYSIQEINVRINTKRIKCEQLRHNRTQTYKQNPISLTYNQNLLTN